MPLGIVSPEEFEKEKNNSLVDITSRKPNPEDSDITMPIVTSDVLQSPGVGRDLGVPNVPQSLRKILGEATAVEGLRSAMELAKGFGISQPTASTYARGEVSPGTKNQDLLHHINSKKTKISKRALGKLNMALNHIDDTKLQSCDAVELSNIAKNMAAVSNQMTPDNGDGVKPDPVQFHFYAPQVRQENHYETVTAKDNY